MFLSFEKNFWWTALSLFFFMTGFNIILPEMNNYITQLGGEDKKGLIITFFTISALFSRPFSGKLADTIGRKLVINIGIVISIVVSLLYPFANGVVLFLILRLIHGFSAGFCPTGTTALITDVIPPDRRGHGMGIFGTFVSLGIGCGQGVGSYFYHLGGFNLLFVVAAIISIISLILALKVQETLPEKQKFDGSQLKVKWNDVIEPSVVPAALVMVLTAPCSGIIFVLTPDIAEDLGLVSKGIFLGIYSIPTIIVRVFYGPLFGKLSREITMIIALFFLIGSLFILGFSESIEMFYLSAVIFGIATGISSPTLFAWTADLCPAHRRGVGAGTLFIALELGIMIGASSTLFFFDRSYQSIQMCLAVGFALISISLVYLMYSHYANRKSTPIAS